MEMRKQIFRVKGSENVLGLLNCIDHIKIDNGKYEIIIGSGNGNFVFKALRNGEEWLPDIINLDGSNMIMSMAYEIQRLRNELSDYRNGNIIPIALLDKDHIDSTYRAVIYAKENES